MIQLPFGDRAEAGRALATELGKRKFTGKVIVLALPRGGLPVGLEVAKALGVPLDVVIVRKLGVPWQPELAMGAIASGSFQTLDEDLIGALGISRERTVHHRTRHGLPRSRGTRRPVASAACAIQPSDYAVERCIETDALSVSPHGSSTTFAR